MTHSAAARFWPRAPAEPIAADRWASVAAIMLVALTAAGVFESQSLPDKRDAGAAVSSGEYRSAVLGRETMIGAYTGAPYTYPSDVAVKAPPDTDFTVRDVTWDAKPFEDPIYYGARVAHWTGGGFGAMVDFTHGKTISQPDEVRAFEGRRRGVTLPGEAPIKDVFHKLEFSHGHNMLTANGLMRLPAIGARFSPYMGVGAGISLPHTEVHLRGEKARTYEYQFAGPVVQALAGVEIRLPRVSVFVEYKFSWAPYAAPLSRKNSNLTLFEDVWQQMAAWWRGEAPPGGFISTQLTSHQLIGGVGVRIGAR